MKQNEVIEKKKQSTTSTNDRKLRKSVFYTFLVLVNAN